MKRSPLQYPWLSTISGLLLAAYLFATSDSDIIHFYNVPAIALQWEYRFGAIAFFVIAIIFDIFRFQRGKVKYNRQSQQYEQQIKELFKAKNALQHKVQKYSDHADKMKLFISDRLLEYLEYDEKFLHFKNIASEVRHNGVICYDKVVTALADSIATGDQSKHRQYEDALDSMRYLWDLLDLSTTDNIALYIANKLYESEEQYYQQLLAGEGEAIPYTPTYSARAAVITSLRPFLEQPEALTSLMSATGARLHYEDSRFLVDLDTGGNLLGNQNYLVLLAENLINNALYYTGAKNDSIQQSRIAVYLRNDKQQCKLSIYNKGPNIPDDIKERIFQLGFSTKRAKDNNGKGLGLYFVQQIVKGYEGEIGFENISNRRDVYAVRVELENGETTTDTIYSKVDDAGAVHCHDTRCQELFPMVELTYKGRISSLEVMVQSTQNIYTFQDFAEDGSATFYDPQNPARPRWCLEVLPSNAQHKLIFRPLDVTGVVFHVTLPTAESRLDAEYHERDGKALPDLEELDQSFVEAAQPYS